MSFGESVFLAGFIQKTIKEDTFVKENYRIPSCKQHGKILEDSKTLSNEADPKGCHVGPIGPTYRPTGLWVTPVSLRFESQIPTAS
jgi:hypothetical protein